MPDSKSRRSFIAKGVAAGAASILAGTSAQAAFTPPPTDRKLKIGVIGVGRMTFMTYSWSDIIEGTKPGTRQGNFGMPFLNMEITHVWDPSMSAAERFANQLSIKAVKRFDDMLGEIDGLIFADMIQVPYMKTLAKPYLESGVPTYLSRPIAYSLRDIDDMLESAAKGGDTPIMATTKFEHYREVSALRNKLKNVGTIRAVQVVANTGDYPMHFHIHQMMPKILGYDVKQISLQYENATRTDYVHQTMLYAGNRQERKPSYVCTIDGCGYPDAFHIRVIGDSGIEEMSMPRGYDNWQQNLQFRYAPQIIDMQRTFYGTNYEPYDIVRKKTELFLTAFYSKLERGGAPVDVGTVPVDWRANPEGLSTSPEFNPESQ